MIVAATLIGCLVLPPGEPPRCERKDVRLDAMVCHLPVIRGELPLNGEWRPATFRFVCGGR